LKKYILKYILNNNMSKSFLKQFEGLINSTILEFCKKISINFPDLNEQELFSLWSGEKDSEKQTSMAVVPVVVKKSPPVLQTSEKSLEITKEKIVSGLTTKEMLTAMCKAKGLKVSGKKEELISRLLDCLTSSEVSSSSKEEQKLPTTSSMTATKKNLPSVSIKKTPPPVIKSVSGSDMKIKKNSFGNYEHLETHLIFDGNKMVCGVQLADGLVASLTEQDIETCKKYKFSYNVPNNLNTAKSLDDIKVEDLDDDELNEEDLEDELVEEEELEEDEVIED
jgi:hypothetical protein